MKVYSCPDEVAYGETDWRNYDHARELARQDEHQERLASWLRENGYPGANTGKVVSFPVADGHASYMLGEGRSSCLIHLPYGDAYQYRDAAFLPKAEILRRIAQREALSQLLAGTPGAP